MTAPYAFTQNFDSDDEDEENNHFEVGKDISKKKKFICRLSRIFMLKTY